MTPKLPAISAKELVRVAERLGFSLRRQRGSHAIYVRASDQARVVIPMHGGDLKRKALRSIIQDLNTMEPKTSKTKTEKALEVALEIRKFEIDMYWKRAAYFWAFLALILGSYAAVFSAQGLHKHPLLKVEALLSISCLGVIFSTAWYFVNRGSKFWQENWEKHVDLLEDSVHGPLYKTVLSTYNPNFCKVMQSYPFSVSKINQILSLVTICVFSLLTLMMVLTILLYDFGWWPPASLKKCLSFLAMIVTFLATVVILCVLRYRGETARWERNHIPLDLTKYQKDFDLPAAETKAKTIWVWNRNEKIK